MQTITLLQTPAAFEALVNACIPPMVAVSMMRVSRIGQTLTKIGEQQGIMTTQRCDGFYSVEWYWNDRPASWWIPVAAVDMSERN